MVHELIGIEDNKVDLKHLGKSPKDQQEVVLSSEQVSCILYSDTSIISSFNIPAKTSQIA
ncbi:hypothetical protein Scep_020040 [Stephania cephalantha]|uniref:Uncharacterized protein n=1 Tax=Stephania cephalantha TaxID=152367 RepID=A0AAP0IBW0_9MAGN